MSERENGKENEKEKKELSWSGTSKTVLVPVKVKPVLVPCKPSVEVGAMEPTEVEAVSIPAEGEHNFETTKVYVIQEAGAPEPQTKGYAICPVHHLLAPVDIHYKEEDKT